jgi:hypothetical protein
VEAGTIRIIDLAFVGKSVNGDVVAMELTDIDPEVRAGFEKAGVEVNGLFNEDDLQAAGEELEPNSSAALLVWENACRRRRSRRRCGTPGACFWTSSACRTRSSRPPARRRSHKRKERRRECLWVAEVLG